MTVQPTTADLPKGLTAEDYLTWSEDKPGRYELVGGEVVAMAPERVSHGRAKTQMALALHSAVRARGLACEVFIDGMAVRVSSHAVYEPDVMLRCGPDLPPDDILVPDPLVVVEVWSPSTYAVDMGVKFSGYFSIPSVRHYLLVNAKERLVIHHRRGDGGLDEPIESRILQARGPDATLLLDPPGLSLPLADLFSPEDPPA